MRIALAVSGLNPGDMKKRAGWQGSPMPYPRVIPHSDGAGIVDALGPGVPEARIGERVWCFGAQSYRAFGTAAEYVVVPEALAEQIKQAAPNGVHRIADVDFTAHAELNAAIIAIGGTVASYFSSSDRPQIRYWDFAFKDVALRLLGSDDFAPEVKTHAASEMTKALVDGDLRSKIAARFPLDRIAEAHELVEAGAPGRVLIEI